MGIQSTRREETKAVKQALVDAGYKVKSVGHGKGTARGWLDVKLFNIDADARNGATRLIQEVTGRFGPYDGAIMVEKAYA